MVTIVKRKEMFSKSKCEYCQTQGNIFKAQTNENGDHCQTQGNIFKGQTCENSDRCQTQGNIFKVKMSPLSNAREYFQRSNT